MKRTKILLSIFLILISGTFPIRSLWAQNLPEGEKKKEYTLFDDLKTSYRIALGHNASDSEQWAARELQHWLREISGAYFPVQFLEQSHNGPQIILGYNDAVRKITGKAAPQDTDESYHYFNSGTDIVIYGGRQRGTMYGVMSFLENEFGCRWYTPAVTIAPKRRSLAFSSYDHSESPGVKVRNDFLFEAFDPVWAARNKMNGRLVTERLPYQEQPGGTESYWTVHTFYPLMPPSEFFDKHPEYYSLINRKRVFEVEKHQAQLCLSNRDVLKIITDRIKDTIRKYPEYPIYDVSQNDSYHPCMCDKCQAIVKREGGHESGLIIWFVNQVAEAIEKEFPDKYIGTLAYQYTRSAPRNIRPRKNVVVRLCPIEACVAHTLDSCPKNKSFMDDLKAWAAISPQLYIWDYVANFTRYLIPYPNFYVLQPNIKAFRDNRAIGIMEQGSYQSRGGEFQELKCYTLARLLWNPECDMEEVVNDFIFGYYGRSGRYIRAYFDLVHSLVKPNTHMHIRFDADDKMFNDEFLNKALAIFEEAVRVADNPEILARVELTACSVYYLKCKRQPVAAREDGTFRKLLDIVEKEKVTWAESTRETKEKFSRFVMEAR